MTDFILEEMEKLEADGVDFVPILINPLEASQNIHCSYSKEEWKQVKAYPKSGRLYWKVINGRKFYLIEKR